MPNRNWHRMFREESEMAFAGATIWAFVIFGGVFALGTLYILDSRTELAPLVKGAISVGSGGAFGVLAASYRWVRLLSQIAVCALIITRIILSVSIG